MLSFSRFVPTNLFYEFKKNLITLMRAPVKHSIKIQGRLSRHNVSVINTEHHLYKHSRF